MMQIASSVLNIIVVIAPILGAIASGINAALRKDTTANTVKKIGVDVNEGDLKNGIERLLRVFQSNYTKMTDQLDEVLKSDDGRQIARLMEKLASEKSGSASISSLASHINTSVTECSRLLRMAPSLIEEVAPEVYSLRVPSILSFVRARQILQSETLRLNEYPTVT